MLRCAGSPKYVYTLCSWGCDALSNCWASHSSGKPYCLRVVHDAGSTLLFGLCNRSLVRRHRALTTRNYSASGNIVHSA